MTASEKIDTLTAILTLAITWSYRCAAKTIGMKAIKRKAHGRREKSWFRIGLDALRAWITFNPQNAVNSWKQTFPKPLKKLSRVLWFALKGSAKPIQDQVTALRQYAPNINSSLFVRHIFTLLIQDPK